MQQIQFKQDSTAWLVATPRDEANKPLTEEAYIQEKKDKLVIRCFHPDTLVHARYNGKPGLWEIQHVGPDHEVLSRCEKTGQMAYKKVLKRFEHDYSELYDLHYALPGETWSEYPITATGEHPFWVNRKGWTETQDLLRGDELFLQDGSIALVRSVTKRSDFFSFNLEVEDFHTYFVGARGVWVHNKNENFEIAR